MQNEFEGLLTVKDAAKILNLCPLKTYRLCWTGQLESISIGRARRIPPAAVRKLMQTGTTDTKAA